MQTALQPSFGQSVKLGFVNYAKCSGRSRRSEYFYFMLFLWILECIINFLFGFLMGYNLETLYAIISFVFVIFFFATIIPCISATVRRLHDTGRSGGYIFITFIPIAGPFILLYFCCEDSEANPNEYGPSPKYISTTLINTNVYNPPGVVIATPVTNVLYQPTAPIATGYPQPNPMAPQVVPYPQPNPIPPQVVPYPQPNPMPPQPTPYQQPPPTDPYYNSTDFQGQ